MLILDGGVEAVNNVFIIYEQVLILDRKYSKTDGFTRCKFVI